MSLFDVLGAGRTGLSAASTGLSTTTHNVTNASNEGFTRRSVSLVTADPVRRGLHWLGQGVEIAAIGRSADALSLGRLLVSAGEDSAASTEHSALVSFESLFESSSGPSLRGAIDGLFDAFGSVTADPGDLGLRREVTAAASELASSLSGIATGLVRGLALGDERISGTIDQVNADLAKVAALNDQIVRAGGPLSAGDLADERDQALVRLADTAGATASFERDGTATVRISGHAAVSGANARSLSFRRDPSGDPVVALSVDGGSIAVTSEVGGIIGGELSAREALSSWLSDLDVLATDLATALNSQHTSGYTSSGAPGGPLFVLPSSGSIAAGLAVDPSVLASPDNLALAASPTALAGDGGNALALAGLEGSAIISGQTAGAFASALTGRVGSETAIAGTRAQTATATRADAMELYANLTSVDLDEEAVKLVQYQAAYQAAAKVIQTTDTLLETLMQLGS